MRSRSISVTRPRARKLTEAAVADIIRRYLQGDRVVDLAQEHGVHASYLYAILRGEAWTHVPRPDAPQEQIPGGDE